MIDWSSRALSMTAWALMMESFTWEPMTPTPSPMDAYGPTTDPSSTADGLVYEGEITVAVMPAATAGGASVISSRLAGSSASTVPQSYQWSTRKFFVRSPPSIIIWIASASQYSPFIRRSSVTILSSARRNALVSRMRYAPITASLLGGSLGFSMIRRTYPSASSSTTPSRLGSSTYVTQAIDCRLRTRLARSPLTMVSPNTTNAGSPSRWSRAT